MPLALDYEPVPNRPVKRRKLQQSTVMARQVDVRDADLQRPEDGEEPRSVPGCDIPAPTQEQTASSQAEIQTSDRDELIQCIKRGQRPTWVPKPGLKALYAEEEALRERRSAHTHVDGLTSPGETNFRFEDELLFGPWNSADESVEPSRPELYVNTSNHDDALSAAISPTGTRGASLFVNESKYPLSTSPPSWLEGSAQPLVGQAVSGLRASPMIASTRPSRPRAPSLSSSFIMRVPTSPLVNAVNNPYLDFSAKLSTSEIPDMETKGRRRTMPPNSFQSYSTLSLSLDPTTPNFSRPLPPVPVRREASYQGHQPRRSIGSFTLHSSPSVQSPTSHTRRPSLVSEASPKRRTSMIGSFEESILRGRMSSPASKPFDFVAQIGVMGKGECPANLKCPAHVSVSFQAVFYSYPSTQASRTIADDAPSPYVGTIDIEHNLKPIQLATKHKRRSTVCLTTDGETLLSDSDPRAPENTPIGKALARDAQLEQQKQSPQTMSRMNLGGAYRVPQQGQLQIIIKNSNKTAVKLFLVPYDLQDMEPGTKTFIRQRSYQTGPIVEGALSDKSQQPNTFDPLKNKQLLRYLIHIRFCCPSKGKFYLYDNVRVVFANRVPDGKEKLRNEVQLPEPRYSPWKASNTPRHSISSATVEFSPVESSSRQSSSASILDDLRSTKLREPESIPEDAVAVTESTIPFHISDIPGRNKAPVSIRSGRRDTPFVFPDMPKDETSKQIEQTVSPVQGFFASTSPRASPIPWSGSSTATARPFSPTPVEAGSGLLSRQFRELRSLSVDEDEGGEIVMGAQAATASLSRILSGSSSPPDDKERGEV